MTSSPDDSVERTTTTVKIPMVGHFLMGDFGVPQDPRGLVVFAHGSGSSRHSPRNMYVAGVLERAGLSTLLIDLLTEAEESLDRRTGHLRFDIDLLAGRLVEIMDWLGRRGETAPLPIGLFGASTGGAAALVAAVARPGAVHAVVSRGGRPDLAGPVLPRIATPTLLIVGGLDTPVVEMNREAMRHMPGDVVLDIVPGATHLFEEPGALEHVAERAVRWFTRYLVPVWEARHGTAVPHP